MIMEQILPSSAQRISYWRISIPMQDTQPDRCKVSVHNDLDIFLFFLDICYVFPL